MRSGRMKSSTAAPSLRNSGLETTLKSICLGRASSSSSMIACFDLVRGAHRHRRLGDHDLVARPCGGRSSAPRRRTCCRSAEPSSPGGVPTAIICSSPCATLAATSVEKLQPAGLAVALARSAPARARRSGSCPRSAALTFACVHVQAEHVVARVREAGARDQADVAGTDDGDFHAASSWREVEFLGAPRRVGLPAAAGRAAASGTAAP